MGSPRRSPYPGCAMSVTLEPLPFEIRYPDELPGLAAQGRHRRRHPRPPGRDRRRRDRERQDDPAAEDLPRARARPRRPGRSGTPSRGGSLLAPSPSGSPRSSASSSATYVGYKVRFTDRSSDRTAVKVMTDGILLAEIQRDRELRRYDTIIIDEAHERSLNIDFILGYLKQLLPRRPDLKLIITSATIDPERFSAHFDDAPIIEVSGRTYPVEVRYRELDRGPDPRHRRRRAGADGRGPRRHPRLLLRGAGDPRCRRRAEEGEAPTGHRRSSTCCRCTPGCRPPSSTGSSPRTRHGASCSPPTSPRRR